MIVLDGVEMLDVREAARLARRTPETVRRWVWSGRLSARREGNRLLVPRRDVESLVRGESSAPRLSLADWSDAVQAQRGAGVLGKFARKASAADLVLDDRAARDAG